MSYFNSEQQGEMARLSRADPKTLCLCGWWDHGQCDSCSPEFTHADRLAERCKECGNYPSLPGENADAAKAGSHEWGDPGSSYMAQCHKAITAAMLATEIRALTQHNPAPTRTGEGGERGE